MIVCLVSTLRKDPPMIKCVTGHKNLYRFCAALRFELFFLVISGPAAINKLGSIPGTHMVEREH